MFMIGGAEIVVKTCIDSNNKSIELYDDMTNRGLRVLCIAYKQVISFEEVISSSKDSDGVRSIEKDNFILLAQFGIKDPIRDDVEQSIAYCHQAGIVVMMVTGDG